MATKKETKTTTTKKTVKKPTTKKTIVKKVEPKLEVKKDIKVATKVTKEKVSFLEKVKRFFNSPQPLFIVFTLIIVGLLLYIVQYTKHDTIMTGSYVAEDGSIGAIHCFSNHKINVFYATPASYTGADKKVFGYNIGYYYESGNELKPFLVRSGSQDTAVSIKQIISEKSAWNVSELASSNSYFTEDVMNNLDKLHFVVYAATQKDTDVVDYVIDFKVEVDKIL